MNVFESVKILLAKRRIGKAAQNLLVDDIYILGRLLHSDVRPVAPSRKETPKNYQCNP